MHRYRVGEIVELSEAKAESLVKANIAEYTKELKVEETKELKLKDKKTK